MSKRFYGLFLGLVVGCASTDAPKDPPVPEPAQVPIAAAPEVIPETYEVPHTAAGRCVVVLQRICYRDRECTHANYATCMMASMDAVRCDLMPSELITAQEFEECMQDLDDPSCALRDLPASCLGMFDEDGTYL